MAGEFLAEAGGEQQCVVGGGADDQDGEDALHLPVDADDVAVGERVDDGAGQAQREHRADDDHQGQQDAAVDQQQDHQHRDQRDAEQQPVDAGEGVGEVGLGGGRSGELRPGAGDLRGGLLDALQDVGQAVAEVGFDLDDGLQGLAVA